MAEFQEVMKQYGRMCETQKLCTDACQLNKHESSICYTVGRAITDTSIEQVEQRNIAELNRQREQAIKEMREIIREETKGRSE